MSTGRIDYSPELRPLYDAACRARLQSTKARTFEEWRDRVSDYGLASARQALEAEIATEHARLEREVIEAAKAEHIAFHTFRTNTTIDNWQSAGDSSDRRRDAVAALMEFESENK